MMIFVSRNAQCGNERYIKGFAMNRKKFAELIKEILKFRDRRDWTQFPYHKNRVDLKSHFE
jgi:hypothetical protein